MRPVHDEHPSGCGPEWDPDEEPFLAAREDAGDVPDVGDEERLRHARTALERLADELQDADEALDDTLEELEPPDEDGTRA